MWKRIWYKCLWQIIDSEFQVLKVKQVEKTTCGQIIVEWKWKLQYVKQFWNIIQVQLKITILRLIDIYHYQITYYQIVILCRYTFDNYISKNLSTFNFRWKIVSQTCAPFHQNGRWTNKIPRLYDSQLQTSHGASNWYRRTCLENWIFHACPWKTNGSTRTRLTVINLSRVSCSFEDNTVEFCPDVTKTRSETSGMTERGRKFSWTVDGFQKLNEISQFNFLPNVASKFSKLVEDSKVKYWNALASFRNVLDLVLIAQVWFHLRFLTNSWLIFKFWEEEVKLQAVGKRMCWFVN